MFLNLIINAIIWIAICKMSFICAKFTTIAQYGWFQDAFFALENFAKYRLKREKLAQTVLNFSYSKAFYCRPCHSFWISLHLIYFWFRFTKIHLMPIDIFLICALSYLVYLVWKSLEIKENEANKEIKDLSEVLKNTPWTNSGSQYGNYEKDLCLKTKPKNNS